CSPNLDSRTRPMQTIRFSSLACRPTPSVAEDYGKSWSPTCSTQRSANVCVRRRADGSRVRMTRHGPAGQRVGTQSRRERQMVELVRRQRSQAGRGARGRWWSSRRSRTATFVVAALALELLPLEGTLLLVTGAQGTDLSNAPAPPWYVAGVVLL